MSDEPQTKSFAQSIRDRPLLTLLMVLITLVLLGVSVVFLPGEWALSKRLVVGILSGLGMGIMVLATKMVSPPDS
jgi:hypothetical protein